MSDEIEQVSDTELSIALRRLRAWRDGGSALDLPRENYALNAAIHALASLRWACCDRPIGTPHKVSCLGSIDLTIPCPDCAGTGAENGVTSKGDCVLCGGSGRIRRPAPNDRPSYSGEEQP